MGGRAMQPVSEIFFFLCTSEAMAVDGGQSNHVNDTATRPRGGSGSCYVIGSLGGDMYYC
jgi:hypothetical protein